MCCAAWAVANSGTCSPRPREVLAVKAQLDAGVEGAVEHPPAVQVEDPALREAAEERFAHARGIDAGRAGPHTASETRPGL